MCPQRMGSRDSLSRLSRAKHRVVSQIARVAECMMEAWFEDCTIDLCEEGENYDRTDDARALGHVPYIGLSILRSA